jgi:hypothetical protein
MPGDWIGLTFRFATDERSRVEHARIEYAGAARGPALGFSCPYPMATGYGPSAAVFVHDAQRAPTAFIMNTRIFRSAGHGIVRGWIGEAVDLTPTNTFEEVAGGTCPDPVPCPK